MSDLPDHAAVAENVRAAFSAALVDVGRVMEEMGAGAVSDYTAAGFADFHRSTIQTNRLAIIDAERARDVAVRTHQGTLEFITREYQDAADRLRRAIERANADADKAVAQCRAIIRSSTDAMVTLEPTAAEREAPMQERLVPRAPAEMRLRAASERQPGSDGEVSAKAGAS